MPEQKKPVVTIFEGTPTTADAKVIFPNNLRLTIDDEDVKMWREALEKLTGGFTLRVVENREDGEEE